MMCKLIEETLDQIVEITARPLNASRERKLAELRRQLEFLELCSSALETAVERKKAA